MDQRAGRQKGGVKFKNKIKFKKKKKRKVEITAMEQNKERRMIRNENSLRELWDIICSNICIIGVLEGEEREMGPKKIFEDIIAENLSNMGKENSHPSPGSTESKAG